MPISLADLAADLAAESAVVRAVVAPLAEVDWRAETPSAGWSVADQISHLAHYDEVTVLSATNADAFVQMRARVEASGEIDPDVIARRYRHLSGVELLTWYDRARGELLSTFRELDPAVRLPWFGPSMSAASLLTARLMETWAHAQDIADTVGAEIAPTDRLRHVAHIGVGARAFSYAANGLKAPADPVRVELISPSGELWTWGPAAATDRVTGTALDFCFAVTQRRHLDDLSLTATGAAAEEWLSIAQAFAGEPGTGREPLRTENAVALS
ncbi:TIGR03084 family metal-binding protein [Streptomyces albipurpureus]|uniref:TIGR03084 family metal-binding protein n=1 Tax=Streptomyces albipurpureus TaxID=2897419 RepID=A0ABT0UG34_9ACTN|nr:TIGR03084 family metal-binding protein [Streptomyces sp. CWNU-1]MCM2387583.1 TIGR03084 family metal-binding protein [Streptomyces sp. CWNU-1]